MGEEISWSSSGGQDSSKEATILPKSWEWEDRSLPVDQRVEACLEVGKISNSHEVRKMYLIKERPASSGRLGPKMSRGPEIWTGPR